MSTAPRKVRRAPARQHGSVSQDWGRQYSFPELEALWIAAGGPRDQAQTAAAVSLAESGGYEKRPNASGDGGLGLMQITPAEKDSDKALPNMRQAVRKWKAAGGKKDPHGAWSNQWVAYANGSYKKFVIGAAPDKTLLESLASGSIGDALVKPLTGLAAIGKLALGLSELLLTPEGWQQIIKVIIGGTILVWALNQLSKSMLGVNPASGARKVATAVAVKKAV